MEVAILSLIKPIFVIIASMVFSRVIFSANDSADMMAKQGIDRIDPFVSSSLSLFFFVLYFW